MLRVLSLVVLSGTLLLAQLNRATITGNITDPAGAAIPNAKVIARNSGNNSIVETTTNGEGQYSFPNLPTGIYQISAETPSFKRAERKQIELNVREVLRVDLQMQLGSVAETVEVSGELPRLQTDSPEVGTSLSSTQMKDLPMSIAGGRNVENFAYAITPGVSGNSWTSNINGSTSFSKETLLDGASHQSRGQNCIARIIHRQRKSLIRLSGEVIDQRDRNALRGFTRSKDRRPARGEIDITRMRGTIDRRVVEAHGSGQVADQHKIEGDLGIHSELP